MTATKPLPPHGTHARAVGRPAAGIKGCRCRRCRDACNAYDKLRRYLAETGRSLTVDAGPAVEHLRMVLAAGHGWRRTAQQIGCSPSQIHRLISGEQKSIGRGRAQKILALRPDPIPKSRIDATGSVRRVRALVALGHLNKDIAAAAGLEITVVNELVNGEKAQLRRETAEAIDCGYRSLRTVEPPVNRWTSRARNRAARNNWPTPQMWDVEIDDPNYDPTAWVRGEDKQRSSAELVADAEEIRRTCDISWEQIAQRLGVGRATLERARERIAARTKAGAA